MAFRPASRLEITLFEDTDSIDLWSNCSMEMGNEDLVRLFEV